MKSIGIVVTDGVGFRNFILSKFPEELVIQAELCVIYSCLPACVYPESVRKNMTIVELDTFREGILTWFFRKTKEVAHLMNHAAGNFGIADNLKSNVNRKISVKGILTRLAFVLAHFAHNESWILRWSALQFLTIRNNAVTRSYKFLLAKDNPGILFFTHQRPAFIAPMIEAAKQLHIPTSAFIFSWDNLASKGRMAGNFDYYVVWSDLMKSELLQFYPSIKPKQISVGGTPQFEPYVMDEYKTEQAEFYTRFDLNKNRPTICFSCGDISTSKNDELYITLIAEAIQQNQIVKEINLIVRTSPAEAPDRFFNLAQQFSFVKWNYPKWIYTREGHPEPWTQRIPTPEDVKDLRALLEYCDLNINMCSTMSLDFMQFDKPVINPVFGNGDNDLYDDQRFLNYAHYERVAQSNAVAIVKKKEDLIAAINDALLHPAKASAQRKSLLKVQIGSPLPGTSKGIVRILIGFSAQAQNYNASN